MTTGLSRNQTRGQCHTHNRQNHVHVVEAKERHAVLHETKQLKRGWDAQHAEQAGNR